MADRYDERERTGGRPEDRGWERSREELERERRHSGGYGEGRRDDYGRGGREHSGRENQGRENFERQNYGQGDYGREDYGRGEWGREPERGDYSIRGDWGRQGSWGTYGNRPDFSREAEWRNYGRRGEPDWGGYNTGRTNLYGTGGYGGGTGSYSGGIGSYGERGRFTGRGPKNWQRSDDRIREDINERLTDHPDIDAFEIDVQVKNGEVTLAGTVEERHTKRLAEDVAENVSGVREVHNQLKVQSPFASQEQGGARSNAAAGTGSTTTRRD
jgi:hypothetical protein